MAKEKASPINPVDITTVQTNPVVRAIPKISSISVTNDVPVKPGWYLLARVDKNGNEIPKSEVQVSERTYKRTYQHRPEYIVKKNPNQ